MSDAPQGDGWWLASDGRWYPPQSVAPPLPPPMVPGLTAPRTQAVAPRSGTRRSVSVGLSGTLQGFYWALAGFAAISAAFAVGTLAAFNSWWDTPVGSREEARALDDWMQVEDTFEGLAGMMFLAGLVVFILMIIWMNISHKVTQQLWPGQRSWSSGWTVGAWFIPFANAVIPKLVMNEIERIAVSPRSHGVVGAQWRSTATSPIGWLWWLGIVIGSIVNTVGSGIGSDLDSSAGEVRAGYVLNGLGFALVAAGAVFGALYVRRIGGRLSPRGITDEP